MAVATTRCLSRSFRPSLKMTANKVSHLLCNTRTQRTVSKEDSEEVEVFWVFGVVRVEDTRFLERSSVDYPTFATGKHKCPFEVDACETNYCELAQKSVAMKDS